MRFALDLLTAGAIWILLLLGSLVVAWQYGFIGVMLWLTFWAFFFVSLTASVL